MTSSMESPFIFGLPTSHLDLALLWQHEAAVQHWAFSHDDAKGDLKGRRFSTRSWMGWMGSSTTYENEAIQDCLDDPR